MTEELSFHNIPIVIGDNWRRDDTYEGVYPSGARVKNAYFSPAKPEDKCIKPNGKCRLMLLKLLQRFPNQTTGQQ